MTFNSLPTTYNILNIILYVNAVLIEYSIEHRAEHKLFLYYIVL